MLFWDEDPETLKLKEGRCFIAMASDSTEEVDVAPLIESSYAIFDTELFHHLPFEEWHKLAFLVLELDQVAMRDGTLVEFYPAQALESIEQFSPVSIAIAVE